MTKTLRSNTRSLEGTVRENDLLGIYNAIRFTVAGLEVDSNVC